MGARTGHGGTIAWTPAPVQRSSPLVWTCSGKSCRMPNAGKLEPIACRLSTTRWRIRPTPKRPAPTGIWAPSDASASACSDWCYATTAYWTSPDSTGRWRRPKGGACSSSTGVTTARAPFTKARLTAAPHCTTSPRSPWRWPSAEIGNSQTMRGGNA